MVGLLGKHPILSGTALMLGHPIITFLLWLPWFYARAYPRDWFFVIWLPMSCILPLVVNLLVALARRRGGGSVGRLWVLLAVGPACCMFSVAATVAYYVLVVQGNSANDVLRTLGRAADSGEAQLGFALSVGGALVGLLAGLAIARRLIRSGRWETIRPLDLPR